VEDSQTSHLFEIWHQGLIFLSLSVKLGLQGNDFEKRILEELLSPWDVYLTNRDQADVVISHKNEAPVMTKSIILPDESILFDNWLKKQKLRLKCCSGKRVKVDVSSRTSLTVSPKRYYEVEGEKSIRNQEMTSSELILDKQQTLLRIDLIKEFSNILNSVLTARTSTLYNILTGLPVRYNIAPKIVRDFVMSKKREAFKMNYCDKLPLDALRFILVKSIERISGKVLVRKKWKGASSCITLTHDLDTEKGLNRASRVKKLEEKYGVQSAWYIPTKEYRLNSEIVRDLANHGEVGVHGVKHNGDLVRLSGPKLFSQFSSAKKMLEKISGSSVQGFRSPLLQHSSTILAQLKQADFRYDTSIPTWEPKHPQTMGPFGIGTVFPLNFCGIIEIPVSIVQDHQLLYVADLTARETIARWFSFIRVVKDVGGCSVVLSHPEYKLCEAENLFLYEDFLNSLTIEKDCWITTPSNVAEESSNLCIF
jgi:peptidoglycan/xylan/chitin deacetylase (PgdA/CDA1 family)